MELPCMLTDDELQSRGRMLGETIWAIDETQKARSESAKDFKDRLVGLNEQQRKLARIIGNRVEHRMVGCRVLFHTPGEGLKRIVRTDTGEVVQEAEMTAAEKQLNLFAGTKDFERFMKDQGVPPDEPPDSPEPPEDSKLN